VLIGAHVSIAGNLLHALKIAQEYRLNCLQIFSSPPRSWQGPRYSPQTLNNFRILAQRLHVHPVFIHAKYLVNLTTNNSLILNKSLNSLTEDLIFAHHLASPGVIFHPHPKDLHLLKKNLLKTIKQTPADTFLILENSAQVNLQVIGSIFKTVLHPRLKFCLDLAHLFQAGYNLNRQTVLANLFTEITHHIGPSNWLAIHANNSQTQLGSHHDRHASLSSGLLKPAVFTFLLNHPLSRQLPFILETPDNLQDSQILPRYRLATTCRLQSINRSPADQSCTTTQKLSKSSL
jgi:deoxyribonuclease-4